MSQVETGTGETTQAVAEFGADGKATVTTVPAEGVSVNTADAQPKPKMTPEEVAASLAAETERLDKELSEEEGEDGAEGEAEGDEKPEAKQPEPAADAPEDLGEYKADDPEVAGKFDARYFTEEGKLNKDALTAEFWANAKEGVPGSLNEGTYAYLEHRLGISKDLVQDIEAGLVAKHQQASAGLAARVHEVAGGADAYNAAIKWASEGGYTEEQGARLNRLIQTQADGWEDAVEALISRHQKAVPQAAPDRKVPPGPPQRRSTPARQAGVEKPMKQSAPQAKQPEGAEGPAIEPFKDADDFYAALKAASGNPDEEAKVRTRLKVSRNVWTV